MSVKGEKERLTLCLNHDWPSATYSMFSDTLHRSSRTDQAALSCLPCITHQDYFFSFHMFHKFHKDAFTYHPKVLCSAGYKPEAPFVIKRSPSSKTHHA